MRIAYIYSPHHHHLVTGGSVHIRQFIANALALGHEIWTWPGDQHPGTCIMPTTRLGRLIKLRHMQAIYYRVDFCAPGSSYWALPPYRQLIASPLIVWEFNGVPEFGRVIGQSEKDVQQYIQGLRYYGRGCDLVICVSRAMANYVRDNLGFERILIVPNGSDPDLFRPDVPFVERIQRKPDQLNVVWIGSGELSWNNFDLLRQASQILWERNKGSQNITFHIIGQISNGLMRNMPPNVNYHGVEYYGTLPHWLTAMDVGLCLYQPGIADYNSPLKLFDYMSSGLTVVATFQPQVSEVFDELGQSDLLLPPNDPIALADVLTKLALSPERIQCQGQKGRQLVLDFYNWRRATRDIFNEMNNLLQTR